MLTHPFTVYVTFGQVQVELELRRAAEEAERRDK